jgi:hypothetical protein
MVFKYHLKWRGDRLMRELRFKYYVMHCSGGIWTRGTMTDLLLAMPYVLHRFIPPFHVLSDLLKQGLPNEFFPDGLLSLLQEFGYDLQNPFLRLRVTAAGGSLHQALFPRISHLIESSSLEFLILM